MGMVFLALAGAILGFALGIKFGGEYKIQKALMLAPLTAVILPLVILILSEIIQAVAFLRLFEATVAMLSAAILVSWSEKYG